MSILTLPSRTDESERPPAGTGVPEPDLLRMAIEPRAEYADEDDLYGDDDDDELGEADEDLDGDELEDDDDLESDLDV